MKDSYFAHDPTVRIFAFPNSLRATPNRISFSRGTITVSQSCPLSNSYADGSIVPHSESLSLNSENEISCWGERWENRDVSIGILRLYDHDLICSLQLQLDKLHYQQSISGFDFKDPFLRELLARIGDVCDSNGPYHYHRISDDMAGQETVSVDPATGKFVGLHIDAWDQLPEAPTSIFANRLCINLGPQDRTFLFVSQSLDGMQNMLGISTNRVLRMTKPEIGRLFLTTFPDYPVTKLMVLPGEAYIAPTGLVLHDASTKGAATRVKHAAFRGHFDLKG